MGMTDFVVKLGLNSQGVTSGTNKAKADIENLAKSIDQKLGGAGGGIGGKLGGMIGKFAGPAGVAAGAAAAAKFVQSQAAAAAETQKTAKALGTSTERAQAFEKASDKLGAPFDKVKESISEVKKTQSEALLGNEGMVKEYARLGVTLDDLKKKSADDLFLKMSDGLKSGAINAANYSSLLKTMGGGAKDLQTFMKDGFADVAREMEKLGPIVQTGITRDLAEINKGIKDVWATTKGWGSYIAQNLVGAVSSLSKLGMGAAATIFGGKEGKEIGQELLADRMLMSDAGYGDGKNLEDKLEAKLKGRKTLKEEKARNDATKAAEAEKKDAEEAGKLKLANATKLAEMRFNALSQAEQVDELTRRRDGMLADLPDAKNETDRQKRLAEIIEAEGKLSALKKGDTQSAPGLSARPSDSLSKIGGFRGAAESAAQRAMTEQLTLQRQQAQGTARMERTLDKLYQAVTSPLAL